MLISSKPVLPHAKTSPYRPSRRPHFDEGLLVADRSFNFRATVARASSTSALPASLTKTALHPGRDPPMHLHRDFEISSYVLSGELTHRGSALGGEGQS
jgi:quercetin 2,3-dioxygenase